MTLKSPLKNTLEPAPFDFSRKTFYCKEARN